jgi:hypothetical protein
MGRGHTRCPPCIRKTGVARRGCRQSEGDAMDDREKLLQEIHELAVQNDMQYFG